MKRKLTLFTFLLVAIFFHLTKVDAQVAMGLHYNLTHPIYDYEDNLYKNPKGFSFSLMHPIGKSKVFFLGGELGVSMYANESYDLEVATNDLNLETVEIDEEDCFFRYNALLRYIPFKHTKVTPYGELSIGGVSFFSTQMVDEEYEDLFDNQTKFHGTAFNVAAGGGLLIQIAESLKLDIGAMANRGQKTHYRSVAPPSVNARLSLEEGQAESYTHHMNYRLGVILGF